MIFWITMEYKIPYFLNHAIISLYYSASKWKGEVLYLDKQVNKSFRFESREMKLQDP